MYRRFRVEKCIFNRLFTKRYISLICFIIIFPRIHCHSQPCNVNQFCNNDDLGKNFDFRGQSTYGKFSPGDTCNIQAVLYSGNEERILICSDPKLGSVQFKVFRMVKEYKRIIKHIEKKEFQEPIYKTDKKGKPIPKLDDWGKPMKDNMDDFIFEIESYKKTIRLDTIWKIERKTKEEILFDSRKGSRFYDCRIAETEPIMIEMVIPKTTDAKLKTYKGCVGIMIGRIFHTSNFKQFNKAN